VIRLIELSRQKALAFIRKTMLWATGGGALAGICVLVLAKPLARIAFSHNAAAVVPLLRCLSLFPLLCCINYILSSLVLIPFGFDKRQSQFLIVAGLVNVGIGCALIPHYGALGGVMAMIAIEILQIPGSVTILSRGGIGPLRATGCIQTPD
jgi:O-antigen/teichoic acid export membrane protein